MFMFFSEEAKHDCQPIPKYPKSSEILSLNLKLAEPAEWLRAKMPGDYLIFVASAIVSLMDRCRTLCLPGIGSYAAVGCVDLNDALFSVSNSVCIIHLDAVWMLYHA